MTLRDFLVTREQELLQAISELHAALMPLEAELAEVRRAKGALGMTSPNSGGIDAADWGTAMARMLPAYQGNNERLEENTGPGLGYLASLLPSPYSHLTMKQLVLKALVEHFTDGATTRQLLAFFRDAWGRDIARANLSPQLSRLMRDGMIARGQDARWFLIDPDAERVASDGNNPIILDDD